MNTVDGRKLNYKAYIEISGVEFSEQNTPHGDNGAPSTLVETTRRRGCCQAYYAYPTQETLARLAPFWPLPKRCEPPSTLVVGLIIG